MKEKLIFERFAFIDFTIQLKFMDAYIIEICIILGKYELSFSISNHCISKFKKSASLRVSKITDTVHDCEKCVEDTISERHKNCFPWIHIEREH